MKLFFLKQDSLYKIFTTLEKTPKNSQVQIFIESENQFFQNPRWSKQIDAIVSKRSIQATFIAQNDHQRKFFEDQNLNHEVRKESKIRIALNLLYLFFFNIRKFHLKTYENKNYTFFAIFGVELLLVLSIVYGIYSLILPQTTITITPSFEMNDVVYNFRYMYPNDLKDYPYPEKHIIIPIHTWHINDITVQWTLDKRLRADGTMTRWTIRLINTTSTPYSLKINSQVIDDFWIEYTMDSKVSLPWSAGTNQAWTTFVRITSKDNPENNALVEAHGKDITLWQKFYIKNLKQSMYTKQIYGEASEGFEQLQHQQPWYVVMNEIGELQSQLYQDLESRKKDYISANHLSPWEILLPFDSFITIDHCDYKASGDTGNVEELRFLSGSLLCTLQFSYVQKEDIMNWMKEYLAKRSTNTKKIMSIQNNFINFFNILTGDYKTYVIPTKVNIIESYNLETDTNNVLWNLKSQLAGKTKDEAERYLQSLPELERAEVKISPFWYTTVTDVKSRIRIKVRDQNIIE